MTLYNKLQTIIDSVDGNIFYNTKNYTKKHNGKYCPICDCTGEHLCLICGSNISDRCCNENDGHCWECAELERGDYETNN